MHSEESVGYLISSDFPYLILMDKLGNQAYSAKFRFH